jgi:hypothetical protein
MIRGIGSTENETLSLPQILNTFTTALDKSSKPIVSRIPRESLNNRTHSDNATNINRHHQSSTQVR